MSDERAAADSSPTEAEPTVEVRFGAWHAEERLALRFPTGFEVRCLPPDDAPALDDDGIARAFAEPVGGSPLRNAARGRRSAAIAVDDLTRPTPVHRVLPHVLAELRAGGIDDAAIKIVLGTAAHRPMNADEIDRKLGPGISDRFEVVQHDFLGDDLRDLGWIAGGPVHLNTHFLDSDLRVCIGGVIPHNETGFGGGSKMVVPGLAGRATIAHFHGALPPRLAGHLEAEGGTTDRRSWSEIVAREVGVDAVVCCTVNSRRELAGVFVGDLVGAHRAAARQARAIGRTPVPEDWARNCDVVVVNAYPLDTDPIQMGKSLNLSRKLGARCTVVVNAASDGIFYHGMGMGSGIDWRRLVRNVPGWLASPRSLWAWLRGLGTALTRPLLAARFSYFTLNHLSYATHAATPSGSAAASPPVDDVGGDPLVYSRHFPAGGFRRKYRRGRLYTSWDELAGRLGRSRPRARVLVFPCAPIQIPEIQSPEIEGPEIARPESERR